MTKEYYIYAPVGYVQGHLRHGYYEGTIELTEEEKNNKELLEKIIKRECDFIVDDYSIYEIDDIMFSDLEIKEVTNE